MLEGGQGLSGRTTFVASLPQIMWPMCEGKQYFLFKIRFLTALDLNNCLKQIS